MKRFIFLLCLCVAFVFCSCTCSLNYSFGNVEDINRYISDFENDNYPAKQLATEYSIDVAETISEPETDALTEPGTNSDADPVPETKPEVDIVPNHDGEKYPLVLMYHLIMEEPYNDLTALFVRPTDFASHLESLNAEGYKYLFADNYIKTSEKSIMLTFDDGYEDNYTEMFPILCEYNAKATVFLITDMIGTPGYLNVDQIKEMSQSGHVYFGCHTASHCNLAIQNEEKIIREFEKSVEVIESITGKKCEALAYPAGEQNKTVNEIAARYFKYAYISRTKIPDGIQTDMKIPRVYVSRGYSAASLMKLLES